MSTTLKAFTALLAVFVALSSQSAVVNSDKTPCQRLDAAITIDYDIYLIFGKQYVKLGSRGFKEKDTGDVSTRFNGVGEKIDAAVVTEKYMERLFISREISYQYNRMLKTTKNNKNSVLDSLRRGGFDAISKIGEDYYAFKDCNLWTGKELVSSKKTVKESLKSLGLPCGIHAAFKLADDVIAVIKHDKLWLMFEDGFLQEDEPRDANEFLKGRKSFRLCGENEESNG